MPACSNIQRVHRITKSQLFLRLVGLLLFVSFGTTLSYAQAVRSTPAFERFRKAYKSSDSLGIQEAVSDLLESGDLSQVKAHLLTVVKAPKSSKKTFGGDERAFYFTVSSLKHRARSVVPELIRIAEQKTVKDDQLELIDEWMRQMGKAASPFVPVLERRIPFDRVSDAMMTKALGVAATRYEITGSYEGMIPLLERALKSGNFLQQSPAVDLLSVANFSDESMDLAASLAKLYCFTSTKSILLPKDPLSVASCRGRLRYFFMARNDLARVELIRAVGDGRPATPEDDSLDFLLEMPDPSLDILVQLERVKQHRSDRIRAIVLNALVRGGRADRTAELEALKKVLENNNELSPLNFTNDRVNQTRFSLKVLSKMKDLPDDMVEAVEPFLKSPFTDLKIAAAKIVWNAKRSPECLRILVDMVPLDHFAISQESAVFLANLGPAGAPMLPMIKEKLGVLIKKPPRDEDGFVELLKVAAQYRGEASDLIPEIELVIGGRTPLARMTAAMTHYWITGNSRHALDLIRVQLEDPKNRVAFHAMSSLTQLGDDGKDLKDAVKKFYERDLEFGRFTAAEWLDEYASDEKKFQVELIRRTLKTEGSYRLSRCVRAAMEPGLPVKAFEAELEQFVEFGDNNTRGAAAFALVVNKGSVKVIESERKNLLKSTATHPLSLFALLAIKPDDVEAMNLLEKHLSNQAVKQRADALQPVARLGTRGAFAEKLVLACTEEGGEVNQETAREILKVIRGEVPFKSKKERLPPKPIQYVY